MSLSGGTSAKLGDRYEDLWTILCLIELLDEEAEAIQLEPPGPEGDGVELVLFKSEGKEYYQSKRQQTKSDKWTINSLEEKSVISNFFKKFTQDQNCRFFFVSIQDVPDLRELARGARSADNLDNFLNHFLSSKALNSAYDDLVYKLSPANEEDIFKFLQKVEVKPREKGDLIKIILFFLKKLITGNPQEVRNALVWFIKENLNRKITAFELWQYLEKEGFERLNLAKNTSLINRINENNERYVKNIEYRLIPEKFIERDESKEIVEALNNPDIKGVLVSGEAGSGKSGVLYEVIKKIKEQNIPYLVFRVDTLDSGDISPHKIGERLGLNYAPEVALDGITAGEKGVLIIDQLDSVSLASGRLPRLFDCVYELIQNSIHSSRSEITIVLACRNFDIENDRRIKKLSNESYLKNVRLNRIDSERLKAFLFEQGITTNKFSEKEVSLLSLPINLKLFFEIYDDKEGKFDFYTTQDLLEKYWKSKQQDVNDRTNKTIRWSEIIFKLVDYMSENQMLNAPQHILDSFNGEQNILVSEHVLISEDDNYAFFHETFFDYAFSRKFLLESPLSITQWILSSDEQHLFRRVQVKQLFIYLREKEFERYLKELRLFLSSKEIRTHLKHIIYAFLREIDDPTEREWKIISDCLIPNDDEELQGAEIWRIINGCTNWIKLLDLNGYLEKWLTSKNDSLVDKAFFLLYDYKSLNSERVIDILSKLQWDQFKTKKRVLNLISRNWESNNSEKFLDLYIELITDPEIFYAENIGANFHDLAYGLPKKNPIWACNALGAYLQFILDESIKKEEITPFTSFIDQFRGRGETDFFKIITEKAPTEYFDNIFPFFLKCIENNLEKRKDVKLFNENLVRDKVWYSFNSLSEHNYSGRILLGLEESIRLIIDKDPSKSGKLISKLQGTKFANVNALLLKVYQYSGKERADESISTIIKNPELLNLSDRRGRGSIAADLLKVVSQHCSNECFQKIESLLLSHNPPLFFDKEYYKSYLKWFGIEQFILLSSLDSTRISREANKKIQEFQRKFKTKNPLPSRKGREAKISFFAVESPIKANQATEMSNDNWLMAIKKYDQKRGDSNTNSMTGGVRELSHLLQKHATEEPIRFTKLGIKISYSSDKSYLESILNGIAETENSIGVKEIETITSYCHDHPEKPFGKEISFLVLKHSKKEFSNNLLDIVSWYALNSNDPTPERDQKSEILQSGIEKEYDELYSIGINSVRGRATETIAHLIYNDNNRFNYLRPTIESLTYDPSPSVKSCVITILRIMTNFNRELAVELFLKLVETDNVLLTVSETEQFIYVTYKTHFDDLKQVLELMIESEFERTQMMGARQSCLAALVNTNAHDLSLKCLNGSKTHREAVAQIYSKNLQFGEFQKACAEQLSILFNDNENKVRSAASKCFKELDDKTLDENRKLIYEYCISNSFPERHDDLIFRLEDCTLDLMDEILYMTKKFFEKVASEEISNIATEYSLAASELSKLILRAYSRTSDENKQSQCLDLLDKMFSLNVYNLQREISEFQRR